jgi:signal transduction histidine kinase
MQLVTSPRARAESTIALLLLDGAGRDALLAWLRTSALALMTGVVVGRAHLETQRARRRQAKARQAAIGQAAEDERLAALVRLAREVAHDINSPLAVAHSTAVFIRQAPQGDPELPPAWTDLLAALDRIAVSVRLLQQEPAARPTTPA